MQAYQINENGCYIKPVIINKNEEIPNDCIIVQPPHGLYRAKWIGTEWIEDMSQAEIDALNNQTSLPTVEERLQQAEDTILYLLMGGM